MSKLILFKQNKGGRVMGANAMEAEREIYNPDNLFIFAKIVLFLANNTSTKLYRTKLNKLLFYVQFLHFKHYRERLLEDDFICQKYGPVLPNLDEYLLFLERANIIRIVPEQHGSYIIPKKKFTDNSYDKEISTIKEVSAKFDTWTAGEISEYSHKENLWIKTHLYQVIPVNKAEELNEF